MTKNINSNISKEENHSEYQQLMQWSKRVKEAQGHCCQVCGSRENLQVHHLLPKEQFPEWQNEDSNGIVLCEKHHKNGKFSAHGNPIWFSEWLLDHDEDLYRLLMLVIEEEIEQAGI